MAEAIRQADIITDEERERLFLWGEDIFGVGSLAVQWRPKETHFFMDVDGQPLSHVGLLKHEVSVGGKPLTVAGVGGVVTRPEAQGRGYARRLLQHATEVFTDEWNVDAGFLFCLPRLEPYYAALGWQRVKETVHVEEPEKVTIPIYAMVLPRGVSEWPAGEIELQSRPW